MVQRGMKKLVVKDLWLVVPESNMPGFPWLEENVVDASVTPTKLERLRMIGVPYTDADIAGASSAVDGKTEMQALIAYLQGLGIASGGG